MSGLFRRRVLPTYVALAFAISWGAILLAAGPGGLPASPDRVQALGAAALLGPVLATLISIYSAEGVAGWRRLGQRFLSWKVEVRWYAIALLVAPIATLVTLWLLSTVSSAYVPGVPESEARGQLVLAGASAGLLVGVCEEVGWTGVAGPAVRERYGVVVSGLVVGMIWGAWHLLLFWEPGSFSGGLPTALLLVRLFSWLPAYRVLMVWMHDATDSLPIAILMHASLVATTVVLEPILVGRELLTYILVRGLFFWAFALLVVRKGGRRKAGAVE